ncbi:MAG: hypothetical protein AAGA53_01280 [Pseudomonadota bacterium]
MEKTIGLKRLGNLSAMWSKASDSIKSRPKLTRWILAGPITIIASIVIMAGMAFWIPAGEAKLNNIAIPIIVLPIIWAFCFFYVCIEENLPRAVLIMTAIIVSHIMLVTSAFM